MNHKLAFLLLITALLILFFNSPQKLLSASLSDYSKNYQLDSNQFCYDSLPKKKNHSSALLIARSKKIYCCPYNRTIYEIIRSGNRLSLTSIYKTYRKTIHGILKNGKIYSNDPDEKLFPSQAGKIYVFYGKTLRVKNLENGDYDDFTECKK